MNKKEDNGLDVLRKLCNGDIEFMKEMIQVFLRTSPDSLNNIKEGIEKGDLDLIGDYAHKLKSSIQIIGDSQLHALVKKIEQEAKSGDPNNCLKESISELEKALSTLYSYLNNKIDNPEGLV